MYSVHICIIMQTKIEKSKLLTHGFSSLASSIKMSSKEYDPLKSTNRETKIRYENRRIGGDQRRLADAHGLVAELVTHGCEAALEAVGDGGR